MRPIRLILGTAALCSAYPLVLAGVQDFATLAAIEGAAFSAVILWAHRSRRPVAWILLPIVSAGVNAGLLLAWPLVLPLVLVPADWLGLSEPISSLFFFAFYSSLGALLYAWILDAIVAPNYFAARTYFLVVTLCAFAGLAFILVPDRMDVISVHKALWFSLFAVALLLASPSKGELVANEALERSRGAAS